MKKPIKAGETKTASDARLDAKAQTEVFSRAMKSFNAGDYRKARPLLEEASKGPGLAIKETATMYIRMCDQRLAQEKLVLETAEDYYNYGVGLMNDRRPSEARSYLQKAVSLDGAPHVHYAYALASGLSGDLDTAATHLRRAVELDPATRGLARGDSDFQPLLQNPAIREILTADRSESA
jgi:Tfp pilus assembly protein PilF